MKCFDKFMWVKIFHSKEKNQETLPAVFISKVEEAQGDELKYCRVLSDWFVYSKPVPTVGQCDDRWLLSTFINSEWKQENRFNLKISGIHKKPESKNNKQ